MADVKKYVSLDKLTKYDTKIKGVISAGDEATLAAAKAHAEGLASNYDAAGAAATAESNAKSYTDTEVAKANSAAAGAQSAAEAAQAAAEAADGKAVKAQEEVDALEQVVADLDAYVGDIPEGYTEETVIAYINKKAEETLNAASGGSTESAASVKAALDTEIARAKAAEEANATAAATAQAKADGADAKVDTLIGEDANKSVRTIANEELAAQLVPEAAKESLDTLAEIAAWIQSHPDDASAMSKAIDDLEALVGTLPEGIDQTTVVAYIQALVAAEQARAEGIENGLDGRIDALEAKFGEGEGSVEDMIADAKQAAIDAAAADAATKASAAETAAKGYADTLNTAMNTRVEALEAIDHEHANKAVIDAITAEKVAAWDGAVAKEHEHANKAVIDGISAENVTTWNTVTSKAAQSDLDNAVSRIAANEAAIGAFVEVSEAEINALFGEVQA